MDIDQNILPTIALIPGDCTGIGPEQIARVLADGRLAEVARLVVIGDARVLEMGMTHAAVRFDVERIASPAHASWNSRAVQLVDLANIDPLKFPLGKANAESGRLTGETLSRAIDFAKAGEVDAVTFAPLNKRVEGENNPYHSSQFRYVAEKDLVICPQQQELKFHHRRQRNGVELKVYRNSQACAGCRVRSLCTSERQGRGVDIGPYSEAIAQHRAKMRDPALRELLKERSRIVEPVFAQIKENGGFRRWTVRGLKNVQAQWSMLCATWNLRKIFQVWQLKADDLRLKPARRAFWRPLESSWSALGCS